MMYRYAKFSDEGFFRGVTTSLSPVTNSNFTLVQTDIPDAELRSSRLVDGAIVTGLSEEVIDNSLTDEAVIILAREQRDLLLQQSDWTQVPDAPVDAASWATYRQALRDVPSQSGFPDNITWPTKPTD
jgi:hypothetical protein